MTDKAMDHARLWREAASFSARAHRHQMRRDGVTPYAAHPARVALTVSVLFGCDDPAALATAFLHDVIEDCDVDYDDVAEQFGSTVADCVAALSKDMRLREDIREPAYDDALVCADWRARLVKLADVLDNLSDLGPDSSPIKPIRISKRAIAHAAPIASEHPTIAQAIALVEQAVREAEKRV